MESINKLIELASYDMFNPEINFNIANEYKNLNQTASAISFYLRAAEYGYDSKPLIVYASLIKISECFDEQKGRGHSAYHSLYQAIQYMPNRPEAYFFLSRLYERESKWQECYTFAELGLNCADQKNEKFPTQTQYLGKYCLQFEKAVSGWWTGRKDESKKIFQDILMQGISQEYKSSIEYNLGLF
jgi:tetratricopeptide (TPR) repeat protein